MILLNLDTRCLQCVNDLLQNLCLWRAWWQPPRNSVVQACVANWHRRRARFLEQNELGLEAYEIFDSGFLSCELFDSPQLDSRAVHHVHPVLRVGREVLAEAEHSRVAGVVGTHAEAALIDGHEELGCVRESLAQAQEDHAEASGGHREPGTRGAQESAEVGAREDVVAGGVRPVNPGIADVAHAKLVQRGLAQRGRPRCDGRADTGGCIDRTPFGCGLGHCVSG